MRRIISRKEIFSESLENRDGFICFDFVWQDKR